MADGEEPLARIVTITNSKGLHARASARFVQCAAKFDANVVVAKDGARVSGTSIMGLMMLGAGMGSEIRITASGRQASEALEALLALISSRFGEDA